MIRKWRNRKDISHSKYQGGKIDNQVLIPREHKRAAISTMGDQSIT